MKICLAGTYAMTKPNQPLIEQADFILESFYYFKEWQLPHLRNKKLFLLDSGAFTFINGTKTNTSLKQYIDSYIKFINDYDVKYFFELDIDPIVGYDNVLRIREYIEKQTGKRTIPVWHKARGIDEYKKMVREYDYAAIGGIVTREIKPSEYKFFKPLLQIAKQSDCKIHGLGFTNLKELKNYKFYSVDSTSWKSGNRFGTMYHFKNNQLQVIRKPPGKRLKSGEFYGVVEKHDFMEWVKFQKYADKYL